MSDKRFWCVIGCALAVPVILVLLIALTPAFQSGEPGDTRAKRFSLSSTVKKNTPPENTPTPQNGQRSDTQTGSIVKPSTIKENAPSDNAAVSAQIDQSQNELATEPQTPSIPSAERQPSDSPRKPSVGLSAVVTYQDDHTLRLNDVWTVYRFGQGARKPTKGLTPYFPSSIAAPVLHVKVMSHGDKPVEEQWRSVDIHLQEVRRIVREFVSRESDGMMCPQIGIELKNGTTLENPVVNCRPVAKGKYLWAEMMSLNGAGPDGKRQNIRLLFSSTSYKWGAPNLSLDYRTYERIQHDKKLVRESLQHLLKEKSAELYKIIEFVPMAASEKAGTDED